MTELDGRYDDWLTPDGIAPDRPTHVIAHLSDTHLTSAGVRYNGVLDADAALDEAVARAPRRRRRRPTPRRGGAVRRPDRHRRPGGVPATGRGRAIHRIRPGADLRHRKPRRPDANSIDSCCSATIPRNQSCRFIGSAGCGSSCWTRRSPAPDTAGSPTAHLAELRAELATAAPAGTIVVLHHAPVPPPSPLLSYFALESSSRRALSDAIAGTDVRLILAGHHHLAQSAMLGGVPVAVAGSTAIRTDPLAPAGHERTFGERDVQPGRGVPGDDRRVGHPGRRRRRGVRPGRGRLPGDHRRPPDRAVSVGHRRSPADVPGALKVHQRPRHPVQTCRRDRDARPADR